MENQIKIELTSQKTIYTFIIGNGLGMALDPEKFSLNKALENSWNNLSDDAKNLIRNMRGEEEAPKTENDLRDIQRFTGIW